MPKVPVFKRRTDLPPDPFEKNIIAPKFSQKQLDKYRKPFKKRVEA